MNVVHLDGQKFTGPKAWEALTPERYRQWVRWQLAGADPAGLFAFLTMWFNIPIRLLDRLKPSQRTDLLEQVFDWLDEPPSGWLLPQLRVKFPLRRTGRFVGPGDRLKYLTFGEFMHAEIARQQMDEQPTTEQLAELAAALYRPYSRNREGNRAVFVPADLDRQAAQFSRLPDDVLNGIRINYYGCQDYLTGLFEHLFPKSGSSDEQEEGGTWLDVGLNLARQTGALGTFHEMERTNVYLVLTVLDNILKEQAKLTEKLAKNG